MPGDDEARAIAAHRGKWSLPGVPHRGWVCVDVADLREPSRICEMCEAQSIRYVHYMQHPEYAHTLGVGCVCAGNMEEDINGARERDRQMSARAGKKRRWLSRRWKLSAKGNDWIEADGYRITVYQSKGAWRATVASSSDETDVKHSRRTYPTKNEAKLAAFDVVTFRLNKDA